MWGRSAGLDWSPDGTPIATDLVVEGRRLRHPGRHPRGRRRPAHAVDRSVGRRHRLPRGTRTARRSPCCSCGPCCSDYADLPAVRHEQRRDGATTGRDAGPHGQRGPGDVLARRHEAAGPAAAADPYPATSRSSSSTAATSVVRYPSQWSTIVAAGRQPGQPREDRAGRIARSLTMVSAPRGGPVIRPGRSLLPRSILVR